MDEPVIELRASDVRRVLACLILVLIGGMFWWVGMNDPDMNTLARTLMAGLGALWSWGAYVLWRGTLGAVYLKETGIYDGDDRLIVAFDDIAAIERGMVSMKPSHGVLLKLSKSGPAAWVPGLWWRIGPRVGIGGLTAKHQTRAFSEALELRLRPKGDSH